MASISGFSYNKLSYKKTDASKLISIQSLTAGTGSFAGTYPTGGIPLSPGNLGFPYGNIDYVDIVDTAGDGYVYEWNKANATIQMFVVSGSTGNKLVELGNGVSPSPFITVVCLGY